MPLINCETNLILTWSENCVLASKTTRDADPDVKPDKKFRKKNNDSRLRDCRISGIRDQIKNRKHFCEPKNTRRILC